mgnify:CR=1 FL=1
MTISSADPDRLHGFVDAQSPARSSLADAAASGAAFAAAVMSRCVSRGLSGTNFPAVTALLDTMRADDEFVRGVADALAAADRHDGIASMSDVSVAARLATGRYETSTAAVTVATVAMLGEPANCGLVDDPINAANGNFVHRDVDLVFPGTSAALDLHRWYNSLAADRIGVFGAGWTSVLDVDEATVRITRGPVRSSIQRMSSAATKCQVGRRTCVRRMRPAVNAASMSRTESPRAYISIARRSSSSVRPRITSRIFERNGLAMSASCGTANSISPSAVRTLPSRLPLR